MDYTADNGTVIQAHPRNERKDAITMKHIKFEKIFTVKDVIVIVSFSTALWTNTFGEKAVLAQCKTIENEGVKFYSFVLAPLLILVSFDGDLA